MGKAEHSAKAVKKQIEIEIEIKIEAVRKQIEIETEKKIEIEPRLRKFFALILIFICL